MLGRLTVTLAGAGVSLDARDFSVDGTSVHLSGVRSGDRPSSDDGGRDLWATLDVLNTGARPLRDLSLMALARGDGGLLGSALTALQDAGGADTPDPHLARHLRPGITWNSSIWNTAADWPGADLEAYSIAEADALQARARATGVTSSDDTVLNYGFVAHDSSGARVLPPGGHGQVTLSFHLPPSAGPVPARFGVSLLLAGDGQTRVTRAPGETTAQAQVRATTTPGTNLLILVGSDSDTASGGVTTLRVPVLTSWTPPTGDLYGVIQPRAEHRASDRQAGMRLRTLELGWDRVEPQDGRFDSSYLDAKRAEYWADLRAGFDVVLDLGVQYPPAWLQGLPNSHFVDQHGTAYASSDPGANPVNAVFNAAVRRAQADYVQQVFGALGNEFFAVRLGWGRYGELGYPPLDHAANSYWAYDDLAQGRATGLPDGVRATPLPGWQPLAAGASVSDADRAKAQTFLDWYLDSLRNYHDWQIKLVRRQYAGRLFMLYPSFGVRTGQLERAVQGGLNGATSPEVNTEIQRGFDFARFVAGIHDPLVSPYTTWLDAHGFFVDDTSTDPAAWSPVHYLARLSGSNPLKLQVWGENTGQNDLTAMHLCAERLRTYALGGMFWAFNAELYDNQHASISDYAALIRP